jgi:AcrR family transcriptional regulator
MREELARSALELFAARGIHRVTLDDVAAQAGVTKGSFYWHYRSKKELILASAAMYYRDWHEVASRAIAEAATPMDQIRAVWTISIEMCLFDSTKRVFSTEIFAMALHDPELRSSWSDFYISVRDLLTTLVQNAAQAGQIRASDPQAVAEWMLSTFEGIKHRASFQPQMCTRKQRDALVDGFLRILRAASDSGL